MSSKDFGPIEIFESLCKLIALDKYFAMKIGEATGEDQSARPEEGYEVIEWFTSFVPSVMKHTFEDDRGISYKQLKKIQEGYKIHEQNLDFDGYEWNNFKDDPRLLKHRRRVLDAQSRGSSESDIPF